MTSTYSQKVGKEGYDYSRTRNPTREALEKNIAALEEGKYGLAFASGMAAISSSMALLREGDHVVVSDDVYGGTYRVFTKVFQDYGVEYDFVDATNLKKVEKAIKKNTKMVWIESPSNPLLKIIDIKGVAKIAERHGLISVMDNTFATPYLQLPLEMGMDVVVHSTTKYLGGHSDIVGGAIVTSDQKLHERLRFVQNAIGAVPSPFDCYLVLRGTKTLALRMWKHCENARQIAGFLEDHKRIERVLYPGLESHPQHSLAKKQMSDFGGMVSFELVSKLDPRRFLSKLDLIILGESLGGVESLIEHPASMTHASIPEEEREKIGIRDGLIRLSVGIEDVQDLIEDLNQALR